MTKKYKYYIGTADNAICTNCEEAEETVQHLLFECARWERLRYEILGENCRMNILVKKPEKVINFLTRMFILQFSPSVSYLNH